MSKQKRIHNKPQEQRTAFYLQGGLQIMLVVILMAVGWRSINYVSGRLPATDSGVFTACALHMIQGQVLYKDAWDHKPPMIHFLDFIALKAGGISIDSVRNMERIFAMAGLVGLFFILRVIFKNTFISFLSALFFAIVFYSPAIFHEGNLTEEYGAIFVLFGILFSVLAQTSEGKKMFFLSAASGVFFCCAFLTKEPFLLAAIPWFSYLLIKKEAAWRPSLVRTGFFIAGALLPFVSVVIYLTTHGAFRDWIEVFAFNLFYSGVGQKSTPLFARLSGNIPYMHKYIFYTSTTAMFCFVAGVVGVFCRSFQQKYRYFPLIAAVAFIADHMATIISDRNYDHYYMQAAVSFVLVGACGLALLFYFFEKNGSSRIGLVVCILLCLIIFDSGSLPYFWDRLKKPDRKTVIDPVSQYIRNHSTSEDLIWITSEQLSKYYLGTQRLSPTRYIYPRSLFFKDSLYSTAEEKISGLMNDLQKKPPKFIISMYPLGEFMTQKGIKKWVETNYTVISNGPTTRGRELKLFMNKSQSGRKNENE